MKISILTTVYNEEKYVADLLNSILKQSYENWELVIVNDGSIDGTQSIIERYSDPRIVKIRNLKNKGKCFSQNVAYKHSSGDYITLHGGDDWSSEDRLLNIYNELQNMALKGRASQKLSYDTNIVHYKEDTGKILPTKYPSAVNVKKLRLLKGFSLPSVKLVFPRCIADKCYPIPENLDYEDRWIVFNVLYHSKAVIPVHDGHYIYRLHNSNTWYSRPNSSIWERYQRQRYLVHRDHYVFMELSLLFSGDTSRILMLESLVRKLGTSIILDPTINYGLWTKTIIIMRRTQVYLKIFLKVLLSK